MVVISQKKNFSALVHILAHSSTTTNTKKK